MDGRPLQERKPGAGGFPITAESARPLTHVARVGTGHRRWRQYRFGGYASTQRTQHRDAFSAYRAVRS